MGTLKAGDVVTTIKVGEIGCHHGILCEIIKREGNKFTVRTPHGTELELGVTWLSKNWRQLNDAEAKRYNFLLDDAERINQQFGIRPKVEKQTLPPRNYK